GQQTGPSPEQQTAADGEGGDALLRKQADAQGAEHAAAQMDRGGPHRIIHMDPVKKHDQEDHQNAGQSSDDQSGAHRDVGTAAGDADQAGQTAVDGHTEVGLAHDDPGGGGGGENGGDGGGVGGHQNMDHIRGILKAHGGTGVEAEPAQPEDKQS